MLDKNADKKLDLAIGGQALIEGVMIKSPHYISIAVRKPSGKIIVKIEKFHSLSEKVKILKWPLLRGILNLFEMLVTGMKAINYSADIALEEEEKEPPDKKDKKEEGGLLSAVSFVFSIAVSIALAIFLFKFVPLFITTQLEKVFPVLAKNFLLFNITDGLIRIMIFIGYVFLLSKWKYFARVFEYHGAEHQAVFAYEKHNRLTAENVAKEHPEHPRCGTSFIMIVLLISIALFTMVPKHPVFWINLAQRLAIVPLIAAVGYEILKWAGKRQNSAFVHAISKPGMWVQKITTSKPDKAQIEVAIAAVKGALEKEALCHSRLRSGI